MKEYAKNLSQLALIGVAGGIVTAISMITFSATMGVYNVIIGKIESKNKNKQKDKESE